MRVLIIGGHGFTGPHLVHALGETETHTQVVVHSRSTSPSLDLLDRNTISHSIEEASPDAVVCLAACTRGSNALDFYETNVVGVENLLLALDDAEFKGRLVLVGSSAIYGELAAESGSQQYQEGDAALNPVSHYGISLIAREQLARAAAVHLDYSIYMTRTFNLIGPNMPDHLAFGRFQKQMAAVIEGTQELVESGPLDAMRDFVDVRDAAMAYVALIGLNRPPRTTSIFNVSSGEARAVSEFFDVAESVAGRSFERTINEKWRNPRDVRSQTGSYRKLHDETGWRPRISFEQSVADLLSSLTDAG